jgi:imidazolonepropionase-like amidohydrolase
MLILTNGILIDGAGNGPVHDATIIVEGNRIRDAGVGITCSEDATVIDLNECTVMPGLIDCHLHLGGLTVDKPGKAIGKVSLIDMLSFFLDYIRSYTYRRRLAIENGVTTIRSAGDHYPHIVRLRDRIAAGKLSGPRIITPGPTITAPGGHPAGTIYKSNRYIVENAVRQVDDVSDAREEVKRLVEGRVDCIKVIYSDIDPMVLNHKVPRLAYDVLEALADETHRQGLTLMVHTGSPEETMGALKAGADSIEHGILPGAASTEFSDDIVNMMLENGTFFVPTLATAWAYKDTDQDIITVVKKITGQLHAAGVMIAAGTDSGTPGVVIGKSLHKELELMVEAGLSPMEAILTGTRNAAANLGIGNELGTIEKGKLADMIVVSGNPLDAIGKTSDIQLVIKDGEIVVNRLQANPGHTEV